VASSLIEMARRPSIVGSVGYGVRKMGLDEVFGNQAVPPAPGFSLGQPSPVLNIDSSIGYRQP